MEDIPRVAKRVRQACEPCRRKKSRCSGEQPACRTCARLGQSCLYATEPVRMPEDQEHGPAPARRSVEDVVRQQDWGVPAEHEWHKRVDAMETTLNEVVQILRGGHTVTATPMPTIPVAASRTRLADPEGVNEPPVGFSLRTPPAAPRRPESPLRDALGSVAEIYWKYCELQPLPLFDGAGFVETFPDRNHEVICAVVALASRFCSEAQLRSLRQHGYTLDYQAAYLAVMDRLVSNNVELSTLQTMCILVLLDWDVGRYDRSRMLCNMVETLAKSAQLHRDPSLQPVTETIAEERRRCYWTIDILRRLFGITDPLPDPLSTLPQYPKTPGMPSEIILRDTYHQRDDDRHRGTFGIVAVLLRLSRPWSMAMRYVKTRGVSGGGRFPWHPDSQYSLTTAALMDLGLQLPLSHRYRSIDIGKLNHDILEGDRGYWAPWLTTRLLYHTTLCILNHPLLITLQIRKVQNVSEAFLQQTASTLANHVAWCVHFIELMSSRGFVCSDPLGAYCAAAVATIELQRSFLRPRDGGEKSRENFEECLSFITSMERSWDFAGRAAARLRSLATDMESWSQADLRGGQDVVSIDVNRVLDILNFAPEAGEVSMLGPTLRSSIISRAGGQEGVSRLPRIAPVDRDPIHERPPAGLPKNDGGLGGAGMAGDGGGGGPRLNDELVMSTYEFFNGPFQDFSLSAENFQGANINI